MFPRLYSGRAKESDRARVIFYKFKSIYKFSCNEGHPFVGRLTYFRQSQGLSFVFHPVVDFGNVINNTIP